MKVGAALAAFGGVCFFLAGPMGPCGPTSALGLPLLLLGGMAFLLGWCVSTGALARGLWKGTVLREGLAILVGSLVAFLASVVMGFSSRPPRGSSSEALLAFVWAWPPLVAASITVARIMRAHRAVQWPGLPGSSQ
jgi:hypothetical protein